MPGFYARCHDCGRSFPEEHTVRRTVQVGSFEALHTSAAGAPVYSGVDQYAAVDLCPRCDRLRADRTRRQWVTLGIAAAAMAGALVLSLLAALVVALIMLAA